MRRLLLALPLLASLAGLSCGYRLAGSGRRLPEGAETIAIPAFRNQTARAEAEQFVTYAVRGEFIRRSRLRLVESQAGADLLLEGTITAFQTTPLSYSEAGAASLYEVRLTLEVRLIDLRDGEVAYQASGLSFRESYATDTDNFFAQESGSLGRIADKFADSIVTAILENF